MTLKPLGIVESTLFAQEDDLGNDTLESKLHDNMGVEETVCCEIALYEIM